ncbi:MAG: HIT domain-containing protein [Alphaproteobacteria bacterium]|nr:HIT domain-containing protein [Alphaproteobacteria bacterium]
MIKLDDAYDEQNIFAKILRGDIPNITLYEDDKTLAFMDIMPQAVGHCLVIPKEPAVTFLDLSEDSAAAIMATAKKVAAAVVKAVGAPGFMMAQLNSSAAGQTVPHYHMHILPRHDGLKLEFHARKPEDMTVLNETADKIRAYL